MGCSWSPSSLRDGSFGPSMHVSTVRCGAPLPGGIGSGLSTHENQCPLRGEAGEDATGAVVTDGQLVHCETDGHRFDADGKFHETMEPRPQLLQISGGDTCIAHPEACLAELVLADEAPCAAVAGSCCSPFAYNVKHCYAF